MVILHQLWYRKQKCIHRTHCVTYYLSYYYNIFAKSM